MTDGNNPYTLGPNLKLGVPWLVLMNGAVAAGTALIIDASVSVWTFAGFLLGGVEALGFVFLYRRMPDNGHTKPDSTSSRAPASLARDVLASVGIMLIIGVIFGLTNDLSLRVWIIWIGGSAVIGVALGATQHFGDRFRRRHYPGDRRHY